MSNQEPAFTAYAVTKREGADDWWNPIGAAFPHADGKGYNVVLQALPIDGKVVLRFPKADREPVPPPAQADIRRDSRDRRRDR